MPVHYQPPTQAKILKSPISNMIKYTIPLLIGALVGGFLSWNAVNQTNLYNEAVGGFADTFISLQLATDPDNGECLTTDGTNNIWSTSCGGGGGASSTIITFNDGSQENTGVPTLDFNTNFFTVTESPTDEFNIQGIVDAALASSTLNAPNWTDKYVLIASSTSAGGFAWVATSTLGITGGSSHDPVTVTDSSEIDFTLSTQNITAAIVAASIDETKLDASVNASLDLADSAAQPGDLHDAVTFAGTGTYISLSGQQITVDPITESDISDLSHYTDGDVSSYLYSSTTRTDLYTAGTGLSWTGTTLNAEVQTSDLHSAVTLSGTPDYITLSGQDIVRGTVDVSDDTNLAVGNGVTLTGDTLTVTAAGGLAQAAGGLTTTGVLEDLNTLGAVASDGQFIVGTGAGAFTYESGATALTSLGLTANGQSLVTAANYAAMRTLLDLEAGTDFYSIAAADAAFEAELDNSAGLLAALSDETGTGVAVFGTSPTITSPTLSTFFGSPCTGQEFLQDISDTGAFTCTAASGGGGGGSLSTTTEKVLAGVAGTVSYVTDEFMLGGSASTSAEFLFDYASSSMEIRGTGAATTSVLSSGAQEAVRIGEGDQNSDGGWDLVTGVEWVFKSTTAILRGAGTSAVTAISTALNWTFTGTIDFTGATVNFGAGAIDAITEIATGLKSGVDATLITGTEGTNGNLSQWNSDGDLVDASIAASNVGLANGDVWTGNHDFGGATFLEIPNGTAPTADDPGELAHDTTDNQLILDDRVIRTSEEIFKFSVPSTTPMFVSGHVKRLPRLEDGYTVTDIACDVEGGTSKVMTLFGETLTCDVDGAVDDGTISSPTVTALSFAHATTGATTGAVNYVNITVSGIYTRE